MLRSRYRARSLPWWRAASAIIAASVVAPTLALDTARMRLPEALKQQTTRHLATGFGGANRGRYAFGAYAGDFTRIESRWAVFDPLYAANRGKSSFTVEGPGLEQPVSATCQLKQKVVTIGIVTFDPKRLVYECSVSTDAQPSLGTFQLGQPRPDSMRARVLAMSIRVGQADIDGIRIDVASVHEYEGSKLRASNPTGYVLSHEGTPVGAIELTDANPAFLLPDAAHPPVARAVLLTALALSVLRDPAESALGD